MAHRVEVSVDYSFSSSQIATFFKSFPEPVGRLERIPVSHHSHVLLLVYLNGKVYSFHSCGSLVDNFRAICACACLVLLVSVGDQTVYGTVVQLLVCKYKQIVTVGSHSKLMLTSTKTSRVNASSRLVRL